MKLISVRLDYDKIDTKRLFQGKQGLYLNLILIPTPNSQYSDYLVKQQADKDEEMPILGNASILSRTSATAPENTTEHDVLGDETSDDLQF